ncbi:hypothetical protein D3C74_504250 [compost metagenome]
MRNLQQPFPDLLLKGSSPQVQRQAAEADSFACKIAFQQIDNAHLRKYFCILFKP